MRERGLIDEFALRSRVQKARISCRRAVLGGFRKDSEKMPGTQQKKIDSQNRSQALEWQPGPA
jgi:hypothetical protein